MSVTGELKKLFRIPERFRRRHFLAREKWRGEYEVLAAALLRHLEFTSVLDVGCANGFLLGEFLRAGKRVAGIEVSAEVLEILPPELREVVRVGDFTAARGRWDLVCCVEVAEHIRPRRSAELVAALTGVATRWIFFTAAPPKQHGHGHINCRPRSEWLAMFEALGWREVPETTRAIAEDLSILRDTPWLRENGMALAPSHRPG